MNLIDKLEKNFGNLESKFRKYNINILDNILGIKGLYEGSIIELYGEKSTGKTTLIYNIIKEVQNKNYNPCFIDLDRNFDGKYASTYIDDKNLLYIKLKVGKMNMIINLINNSYSNINIYIIDSIAQIHPNDLQNNIALLKSTISKTKSLVFYTNQIRNFKKKYSYGHKKLKYYTDIRLRLNKYKNKIINLDVMKNTYSINRGNFNLKII